MEISQFPWMKHAPTEVKPVDIQTAFEEIDFERTGFIDAESLQRFFAAIGEHVQPEEAIEMIRLLDQSKKGRITLVDFYKVITQHPDSELLAETMRIIEEHGGIRRTSQEIYNFIRSISEKQSMHQLEKKAGQYYDDIGFVDFCTILQVSATDPLSTNAFKLFDLNSDGKVGERELLLGIMVFSNAPTSDKIMYGFKLYNENGDDLIDRQQLACIIRANFLTHCHLQNDAVFQKVEGTLQIGGAVSGRISLEQLLHVSSLNIGLLYPDWNFLSCLLRQEMQSEHQANFVRHPIDTHALKIARDQKADLRSSHFVLSHSPQEKLSSTMRSDIGVFKEEPKHIQRTLNRNDQSNVRFGYGYETAKIQSESQACYVNHPRQPHQPAVRETLTNPSIQLGSDITLYQSTSEAALCEGQSSRVRMVNPELARLKVAELRKTHINLDPCECDFQTDYSSSYINHGSAPRMTSLAAESINSINLGQYATDYATESQVSYSQYDNLVDACKKAKRVTADNYKSGFQIGSEEKIPLQSESRALFVDHIGAGKFQPSPPVESDKSSHLTFGPIEPTPTSIARDSYHSHQGDRVPPFKPNLAKSNWALGDDKPPKESIEREMMRHAALNSAARLVPTGGSRELRGSHFVLGFETGANSTSSAALVNHAGAMPGVLAEDVKADLRRAHFYIGENAKSDWSTSTGDFQWHGVCRAELDPGMKKDLRSSHFSTAAQGDDKDRLMSLSHASFTWPA